MIEVKVAEEFMRTELITLQPSSDVLKSVSTLLHANISGAPVVASDGTYLGVLSEKCCMNALTTIVENSVSEGKAAPKVRDFMKSSLITLTLDWDVFKAIDHLLSQRISGAPILDAEGKFFGIFSEKTAMRVLMAAIHDSVPGMKLEAYANLDRNRVISRNHDLIDVAHKFQDTPYRRLPVLVDNQLAGQVSRRDVLCAEHRIATEAIDRLRMNKGTEMMQDHLKLQTVEHYMDQNASTITPRTDLLSIAQIFLNSPFRRLPVVDDCGKLVGQVSRRDLLETAANLMKPIPERPPTKPLYLSQITEDHPASLN